MVNMKKTLFGLSIVLLLAGCGGVETTEQESIGDETRFTPELWKDIETGCEYLILETGSYEGGVSITPRMSADGTQICNQGGF